MKPKSYLTKLLFSFLIISMIIGDAFAVTRNKLIDPNNKSATSKLIDIGYKGEVPPAVVTIPKEIVDIPARARIIAEAIDLTSREHEKFNCLTDDLGHQTCPEEMQTCGGSITTDPGSSIKHTIVENFGKFVGSAVECPSGFVANEAVAPIFSIQEFSTHDVYANSSASNTISGEIDTLLAAAGINDYLVVTTTDEWTRGLSSVAKNAIISKLGADSTYINYANKRSAYLLILQRTSETNWTKIDEQYVAGENGKTSFSFEDVDIASYGFKHAEFQNGTYKNIVIDGTTTNFGRGITFSLLSKSGGSYSCEKSYVWYEYVCPEDLTSTLAAWVKVSDGGDCGGLCPEGAKINCECQPETPPADNCLRVNYICPSDSTKSCTKVDTSNSIVAENLYNGYIYRSGTSTNHSKTLLSNKMCPDDITPDTLQTKKTVVATTGSYLYKSCQAMYETNNASTNGFYTIYPDNWDTGMNVYCYFDDEGGWEVIQQRNSNSDFYKDWSSYKTGFGDNTNFWLGLDNIYNITKANNSKAKILITYSGVEKDAKYSSFKVEDETDNFKLKISGYSGSAGDSLSYHNNRPFSTKDKDNDSWGSNCSTHYKGAWWYGSCHNSNLNGMFGSSTFGLGLNWSLYTGMYASASNTKMLIQEDYALDIARKANNCADGFEYNSAENNCYKETIVKGFFETEDLDISPDVDGSSFVDNSASAHRAMQSVSRDLLILDNSTFNYIEPGNSDANYKIDFYLRVDEIKNSVAKAADILCQVQSGNSTWSTISSTQVTEGSLNKDSYTKINTACDFSDSSYTNWRIKINKVHVDSDTSTADVKVDRFVIYRADLSSGSNYDLAKGLCISSKIEVCPSTDYLLINGSCFIDPICSGFLDASGNCYFAPDDITCPSGYTYNISTLKCEKSPECIVNGNIGNIVAGEFLCSSTPNCDSGWTYMSSSGYCETPLELRDPICPEAFLTYNETTGVCKGKVDMTLWSKENPSDTGIWDPLPGNNFYVKQMVNSEDITIFLSSKEYATYDIEGTLNVADDGDNDWIGLVFGYSGSTYFYFDYTKTNDSWHSKSGRLIKVDNGTETVLAWSTPEIHWTYNTDQVLRIKAFPKSGEVKVFLNNTEILNTVVTGLPESGKVGFLNHSQSSVTYGNFTVITTPICEEGYTYDSVKNKCYIDEAFVEEDLDYEVSRKYPTCFGVGGSYDFNNRTCLFSPECSGGGTIDFVQNKCVTNPVSSCNSGSLEVGVDLSGCSCPSGFTINTSTMKCEQDIDCPFVDNITGTCYESESAQCNNGGSLITSSVFPGYNYACSNDIICRAGTTKINNGTDWVCDSGSVVLTDYHYECTEFTDGNKDYGTTSNWNINRYDCPLGEKVYRKDGIECVSPNPIIYTPWTLDDRGVALHPTQDWAPNYTSQKCEREIQQWECPDGYSETVTDGELRGKGTCFKDIPYKKNIWTETYTNVITPSSLRTCTSTQSPSYTDYKHWVDSSVCDTYGTYDDDSNTSTPEVTDTSNCLSYVQEYVYHYTKYTQGRFTCVNNTGMSNGASNGSYIKGSGNISGVSTSSCTGYYGSTLSNVNDESHSLLATFNSSTDTCTLYNKGDFKWAETCPYGYVINNTVPMTDISTYTRDYSHRYVPGSSFTKNERCYDPEEYTPDTIESDADFKTKKGEPGFTEDFANDKFYFNLTNRQRTWGITPSIVCEFSGHIWNGSTCIADHEACPTDMIYNATTGTCLSEVSDVNCGTGYTYVPERARCEKPITCPTGTVIDPVAKKCIQDISIHSCGNWIIPGSEYVCKTNGTCPEGSIETTATDGSSTCEVSDLLEKCPEGYSLDSTDQTGNTCIAMPFCRDGWDSSGTTCKMTYSWSTYECDTGFTGPIEPGADCYGLCDFDGCKCNGENAPAQNCKKPLSVTYGINTYESFERRPLRIHKVSGFPMDANEFGYLKGYSCGADCQHNVSKIWGDYDNLCFSKNSGSASCFKVDGCYFNGSIEASEISELRIIDAHTIAPFSTRVGITTTDTPISGYTTNKTAGWNYSNFKTGTTNETVDVGTYTYKFYAPEDGVYTFNASADDAGYLNLDGSRIITITTWTILYSESKTLTKGEHTIVFNNYDVHGGNWGGAANIVFKGNKIWNARTGQADFVTQIESCAADYHKEGDFCIVDSGVTPTNIGSIVSSCRLNGGVGWPERDEGIVSIAGGSMRHDFIIFDMNSTGNEITVTAAADENVTTYEGEAVSIYDINDSINNFNVGFNIGLMAMQLSDGNWYIAKDFYNDAGIKVERDLPSMIITIPNANYINLDRNNEVPSDKCMYKGNAIKDSCFTKFKLLLPTNKLKLKAIMDIDSLLSVIKNRDLTDSEITPTSEQENNVFDLEFSVGYSGFEYNSDSGLVELLGSGTSFRYEGTGFIRPLEFPLDVNVTQTTEIDEGFRDRLDFWDSYIDGSIGFIEFVREVADADRALGFVPENPLPWDLSNIGFTGIDFSGSNSVFVSNSTDSSTCSSLISTYGGSEITDSTSGYSGAVSQLNYLGYYSDSNVCGFTKMGMHAFGNMFWAVKKTVYNGSSEYKCSPYVCKAGMCDIATCMTGYSGSQIPSTMEDSAACTSDVCDANKDYVDYCGKDGGCDLTLDTVFELDNICYERFCPTGILNASTSTCTIERCPKGSIEDTNGNCTVN